MPSQSWGGVNTGSAIGSQMTNPFPKIWKNGAMLAEGRSDFWMQYEGGEGAFIRTETDTSKGNGMEVVIRVRGGLYQLGVQGENLVGTNTEKFRWNDYKVTVDWLRHGVDWCKQVDERLAMEELGGGVNLELGDWLGRRKTEMMDVKFRELSETVIANGKAEDELTTQDDLTVDLLLENFAILKNRCKPVNRSKDGKNDVPSYFAFSGAEPLAGLKQTDDYKQAIRESGPRGDENRLFAGGFSKIDGNVLIERVYEDHGGWGPVGSAWQPKALLGDPIVAGTTTFDITGGGSATAQDEQATAYYFRYFRNAAWSYGTVDTSENIAADTTTVRYVAIINRSGNDRGKIGFYSYKVNDGIKLTVFQRLAAGAGGDAVTTLGGVTWDTGILEDRSTDAHPSGSLIVETTENAVPIAWTLLGGRHAGIRAYGSVRAGRQEEKGDGNFVKKVYIESVFGQTLPKREDGTRPNTLMIMHAYRPPGVNYPSTPVTP